MQNEITRDQIRATFLANGFRVKHGRNDLADYVYQAAFALLELHRARIDELEEQLSAIGAGGVEPLRKAAPDKSDGWHLVSKSTQKRLAAKWGFVPASALDAEREDAECFRFWVSEAARAPGAMAKLITHCTTEQEYREAILPVARKAREAMQAALQRLPLPDYDPRGNTGRSDRPSHRQSHLPRRAGRLGCVP